MKKYQVLPLILLWTVLTAFAWFGPRQAMSDAERRPLAQMPEITGQTLWNGKFMTEFESFSLDQFPLRSAFRTVKSVFHSYFLQQKDNNGIYVTEGVAVKQEYPLQQEGLNHALDRFGSLYEKYLTDCRVFSAVVPDKGYYFASETGHLSLDYEALFAAVEEKLPWATPISLTDCLTGEDYYRTDTHWRQEALFPTAQKIAGALGTAAPNPQDFTAVTVDRPFYGVYYGQAALPMKPDALSYLQNDILKACRVYDYETGKYTGVYDLTKVEGKDLYELYLSGPRSLLTIENPNAQSVRELIVFRDSFGSSLVPLLVQGYEKVHLVDLRYIQMEVLDRFLDFGNQDVLFLYSTTVLNNGNSIK